MPGAPDALLVAIAHVVVMGVIPLHDGTNGLGRVQNPENVNNVRVAKSQVRSGMKRPRAHGRGSTAEFLPVPVLEMAGSRYSPRLNPAPCPQTLRETIARGA